MKPIAYKANTIAVEPLPFPQVYYPGFYGAFFGFKKDDSKIIFCSCAREAIENYLKLRLSEEISANSNPNRMFILDSKYFPKEVVESLRKANGIKQNSSIIQKLNFENKLCHECNKVVPLYRYCHKMYGGAFKENFGWYINKQTFEWGVQPISYKYLPDACPEDLLILFENEEYKQREVVSKKFHRLNSALRWRSKAKYSKGIDGRSGTLLKTKSEGNLVTKKLAKPGQAKQYCIT